MGLIFHFDIARFALINFEPIGDIPAGSVFSLEGNDRPSGAKVEEYFSVPESVIPAPDDNSGGMDGQGGSGVPNIPVDPNDQSGELPSGDSGIPWDTNFTAEKRATK